MRTEKNALDPAFIRDICGMLQQARQKTYATVHFIMVETYWRVGRRIVEEEQQGKERADYGAFLIRELSRSLSDEFGKGFAVANLWNFRQFFLIFPTEEKLYALRRELSWSHYRLIMRVDNPEARDYYLREAAAQGWSTRQLERNIHTHYYERLLNTSGEQFPAKTERVRLAQYPPDTRVVVSGYEGGYNDISILKTIALQPDASDKWWMGQHDDAAGAGETALLLAGENQLSEEFLSKVKGGGV